MQHDIDRWEDEGGTPEPATFTDAVTARDAALSSIYWGVFETYVPEVAR